MATAKHLINTQIKTKRRMDKAANRISGSLAPVQVKFLRKDATIRTFHYVDILDEEGKKIGEKLDGHSDKTYFDPNDLGWTSISAAKRASRQLQMENGGLGMGSLRLVTKFPSN